MLKLRVPMPAIVSVAGWLLGSLACAEVQNPVATVTLGVDRLAVPLGAPLALQVRFDAGADLADELAEDYHVFVHFLDDRGELLWTEDHEPPVPTSQWQPDQTVEYEHRVVVPMYPYIGEVRIALGLYSPVDGARVALAGSHLGQLAYHAATIRLDPQHESSFVTYGEGWHSAEFAGDGRRQWRWTSGRGVLSFRNPNRDSRLVLDFDGRPDVFDTAQRLSLVIGDRVLRELDVDSNETVRLVEEISAADLGADDFVELELRVDRTFKPAQIDTETVDTRELGVRVSYMYFEPL